MALKSHDDGGYFLTDVSIGKWDVVMSFLKDRIPAASYNTWFTNLKPGESAPGRFNIQAGSKFVADRLRANYLEEIHEAIRIVHDAELEVEITCKTEKDRAPVKATVSPITPKTLSTPSSNTVDAAEIARYTRKRSRNLSTLNQNYCLENFIAGTGNEIVRSACLRVSESQAEFNPLMIIGESGLGKSHLLQGICHKVNSTEDSDRTAIYITCDTFCSMYGKAVQEKRREAFRDIFYNTDIVIIDDIQMMAAGSKDRTQEELLHIFDELQNRGIQLVIASCSHPLSDSGFNQRLAKRLSSGLTLYLEKPDYDTRVSITLNKAGRAGIPMKKEIAEIVVKRFGSCGREIDGAISSLAAIARFSATEITEDIVRRCLPQVEKPTEADRKPATISDIIAAISAECGIPSEDLTGRKRARAITEFRGLAMLLVQERTGATCKETGKAFGNRNHATVIQSISKARSSLDRRSDFRKIADSIRERFPAMRQSILELEENREMDNEN